MFFKEKDNVRDRQEEEEQPMHAKTEKIKIGKKKGDKRHQLFIFFIFHRDQRPDNN